MATPSGQISIRDINQELGRALDFAGTNLNELSVRELAAEGNLNSPFYNNNTQISFNDLRNKTIRLLIRPSDDRVVSEADIFTVPRKILLNYNDPGSFTVVKTSTGYNTVDYIIIGGGGGVPSTPNLGGGGAGGIRIGTLTVTAGTTYVVEIGAGGANDGSLSRIATPTGTTIVSANGGGGSGRPGGSGGGGKVSPPTAAGVGNRPQILSPPQGNPGGAGSTPNGTWGGGGGAGGAGGAGGSSGFDGLGGIGIDIGSLWQLPGLGPPLSPAPVFTGFSDGQQDAIRGEAESGYNFRRWFGGGGGRVGSGASSRPAAGIGGGGYFGPGWRNTGGGGMQTNGAGGSGKIFIKYSN